MSEATGTKGNYDLSKLQERINCFSENRLAYKNPKVAYNEHSCRNEYIDPLLKSLGWDITNQKAEAPQYREVIVENKSSKTDRPDYSLTLRGVTKFFIEAKKPAIDISTAIDPALQARKYGWNAKHKIVVLTNFEYLAIYDASYVPQAGERAATARYRLYHFSEYIDKFEEIASLLSKEAVYSGRLEDYLEQDCIEAGNHKQPVDEFFLSQINKWRIALSNELYLNSNYKDIEILNDVVQEFLNQIVFLRICEDKKLPLDHKLNEIIQKSHEEIQKKLEDLLRKTDKRYNSGIFSGKSIVLDLNSKVINDIIVSLYYPQSPYLFDVIKPNMLGKIYELFLTEQLIILDDGSIGLEKKKECKNRSIVTTPTEIVKYMVEKALSRVCSGKTPDELLKLRIADISCGSGIYLEEVFSYLESCCIDWYLKNSPVHLFKLRDGVYKLPLEEKKNLLCSCIYGLDIDIHAVEVAKFSLLIKLIENETSPSVLSVNPILPDLCNNIVHGNSLVSNKDLDGVSHDQLVELAPFDWDNINSGNNFDVIIGNPPYVSTKDLHKLVPKAEFDIYKSKYKSSYKQFDKYFIFIEQALSKIIEDGYICYIVPNKFFKIGAGKKLRSLITHENSLISMDDFRAAQLFASKTIYSAILLLQRKNQTAFTYSSVDSASALWAGSTKSVSLPSSSIGESPWHLTTDMELMSTLKSLEGKSTHLDCYVKIFNGIQTSAERPTPIYWFAQKDVASENKHSVTLIQNKKAYLIEKAIIKPFFKPSEFCEKSLNSYSQLETDKRIIFPYDENGDLYPLPTMEKDFPGTYAYLLDHYDRLVPKQISASGVRDVPHATESTWYQYGRTQALTAFINKPKLIVGILSKSPMYIYDTRDMLLASGGTAGYCAISAKDKSPYALEYIQAWLSNPYTEKILDMLGSYFEGNYHSRGTAVLSTLPFVPLDLSNQNQKSIYDRVITATREIYSITSTLSSRSAKNKKNVLQRKKDVLITEIENLIKRVYKLDF